MNTYAISDLHGFPSVDELKALLDKAGFLNGDRLFILGDIIDRNHDGGIELLRYMMKQPEFEFILGNHEDMLLKSALKFDLSEKKRFDELSPLDEEYIECAVNYERWMRNGGGVTLKSLEKLQMHDRSEFVSLMEYLKKAKTYRQIKANGREFLLVHGGLPEFSPEKPLAAYEKDRMLWERPKLTDEYYDNKVTVFGHTPTLYYGDEYAGRVIKTRTWINIDVGCASCLPPALIRLDDLEVFYAG